MRKILSILFSVLLFQGCATGIEESVNNTENDDAKNVQEEIEVKPEIFINQVGYLPESDKYFLINIPNDKYEIVSKLDDSIAFSGDMQLRKEDDKSTGMTLYIGDFTTFTQKGEYYIKTGDGVKSYPFEIGDDVFDQVRNKSLKSFYFQRSGVELEETHAGIFARPAGHTKDLEYHKDSALQGTKDVSGGWYDAGDFGRYITPGSVTLGMMMMGYEQYPEKFDFDDNNIPESGNGVSDFLDEMRHELEWMLKMQNIEDGDFKGALPYMLNTKDYVWELPHVGSQSQYIYDFSTVATADFAAIMAFSARVFENQDSEFAKECLAASELAWDFAVNKVAYPAKGFTRPDDTVTGGYAENAADNFEDKDDKLWAAVELFLTTGSEEYHEYVKDGFKNISYFSGGMNWMDTMGFANLQYLLGNHPDMDTALQATLKDLFFKHCDNLMGKVESDGFKTALSSNEYYWGSNGEVLTRAEYLIFAYQLSNDIKYYNGALSQLNYVLGLNGNNMSYVSKLGSVSPDNIHHAAMATDGIDDSYPGLIAGGPNSALSGDYTLPKYFDNTTPSALCYIDHIDSWASNENCITYNAPLIPVSAFFSK